MRIALVILHADRSRGGAETYTLDLAAALATAGHDVALIASSFAGEVRGVKPVSIACSARTRIGRYRQFVDGVDFYLDGESFDVVHAMLPIRRCDVYHPHAGLAVAETRGARLAALLNPRRLAMARIERSLLESDRPPRVLCLSEYVKADVRKHYSLDEEHLPVLFNAVDTDRFSPSPGTRGEASAAFVRSAEESEEARPSPRVQRKGECVALIIAQDFERKGLGTAITALAKVDGKSLRLRVVGKPDPAKFRKLAESSGVADRVEFTGPTDDAAAEYRAAGFFVLPTRHDPCSLVVLEALASGLPVISTRFNGACEVMTDGVHGFVLTDPTDATQLADCYRQMLDNAQRQKMSDACLLLRPQLSYEHHLRRLMQIYEASVESAA